MNKLALIIILIIVILVIAFFAWFIITQTDIGNKILQCDDVNKPNYIKIFEGTPWGEHTMHRVEYRDIVNDNISQFTSTADSVKNNLENALNNPSGGINGTQFNCAKIQAGRLGIPW